jgi:DNA-binding NtrC family response regulator
MSGAHDSAMAIERILIGRSPAIRGVRELIRKIGPSALPVTVEGPTGSGKELVAQALHVASGRTGRLVAFNVCAIADSMFEDALFGHKKGAFTGAVSDSAGYLAEANGGTVFLDEVSGLPLALQAKLLRVLETREFRPVGAALDRRSDFRVVSATNESLARLVEQQRFRADLRQRLGAVVISLPPLAERMDDVPLLAEHFVAQLAQEGGRPISLHPTAERALQAHHWPANVRELRDVIAYATVLSESGVLRREDITSAVRSDALPPNEPLLSIERRRLLEVMESCGGNVRRAATHLGVHRATLYRQLQRQGLTGVRVVGRLPRPVRSTRLDVAAATRTPAHGIAFPGLA